MNNMIRYGHTQRDKPIRFLVIDDSTDDQKEARYQELRKKSEVYGNFNIDLKLIDKVQKERLIEFFVRKISSTEFTEDEQRTLIQAALGHDGGPGAQRNWADLFGAVTLDDDIHPYCYLSLNDELRAIPVDFVGIIGRTLARPYVHSTNFQYSGKSGCPHLYTVEAFLSTNTNQDCFPYISYGENRIGDTKRLYINQPTANMDDISGGIQAKASSIHSKDIDLPFIPTAKDYLRIEDNVAMLLGQELNAGLTRDKFYRPGGAIYHDISKVTITEPIIRQGILEPLSHTFIQTTLQFFLDRIEDLLAIPSMDKAHKISNAGKLILSRPVAKV